MNLLKNKQDYLKEENLLKIYNIINTNILLNDKIIYEDILDKIFENLTVKTILLLDSNDVKSIIKLFNANFWKN